MADYFIVTAPGLEPITLGECEKLGLTASPETGGLLMKGQLGDLYKANYLLRTANRVLARVGQPFMAKTFDDLGQRVEALPWDQFLNGNCTLQFHVTCAHSKLMHTGVIAKTAAKAIQRKLRVPEMVEGEPQQVHIRIADDKVTVSMDSSGEILYKRGYRQQVTRSPMRETLAAALIFASGWDTNSPLIDPFCGSGTIPIEGALIAQGIPAGFMRGFAFERWPNFDKKTFDAIKKESISGKKQIPPIFGYDRDAGAIEISRANAKRAGVWDQVGFGQQALSHLEPPAAIGHIITNPPYGLRISEGADLRNLYAQLGNVLREKALGWSVTLVTNDIKLSGHARLGLKEIVQVSNGGVYTTFQKGIVSLH